MPSAPQPGVTCVTCGEEAATPSNAWGQRVHPTCLAPPVCESCTAWIEGEGSEELPDGRRLCLDCLAKGVWEPESAQLLLEHTYLQVRELGLRFTLDAPLQVLDRSGFSAVAGRRALGHSKVVVSGGVHRVTRIVILSHLRPLQFRGVLAHELTHAYLHQRVPALPRALTEGLCNYVASRIYLSAGHDPMKPLLLALLEQDPDPHYGGGYRQVRDALREPGSLAKLLRSLEAGVIPAGLSLL